MVNCANQQVAQLAPCLQPPAEGDSLVGPVGDPDGGGAKTLPGAMVVGKATHLDTAAEECDFTGRVDVNRKHFHHVSTEAV